MRFGLKVNPGTWDEASRWARIAEDAGFDGLWTGATRATPVTRRCRCTTGRR